MCYEKHIDSTFLVFVFCFGRTGHWSQSLNLLWGNWFSVSLCYRVGCFLSLGFSFVFLGLLYGGFGWDIGGVC